MGRASIDIYVLLKVIISYYFSRLNSSDAAELFSKCTFKQLPYCFLQWYHFAFSSVMGDKLICTVPILIFGMVSGFCFFFYFIYTKRYTVYLIMALTVTLQQLMMLCRNSVFLNNWLILPGESSELVISFQEQFANYISIIAIEFPLIRKDYLI